MEKYINALKDMKNYLQDRIELEKDVMFDREQAKIDAEALDIAIKKLEQTPLANPQLKMGCEGCIYEKTGNNSTYPCSHCGRCYTDKYKTESEKK